MNILVKFFLLLSLPFYLSSDKGHMCSFPKISLSELIRYTGKIAEVNFIADEKILDFDVAFISQKERSTDELLKDLFNLLKEYNLEAKKEGSAYIIRKLSVEKKPTLALEIEQEFDIYKLRYLSGEEIITYLKESASGLSSTVSSDVELKKCLATLQWVKSSNSLLFSASKDASIRMKNLIERLDVPLKQVYVEVLVLETDVNKGHDFGVSWQNAPSADILSACKNSLKGGLNNGIIGDAIINGKMIFNELSSFIKFVQNDIDTTIVLNQKILTRENKLSTIFEGDTVPFTGSVIELTGTNQRTTSNIEYKDIGVSLSIIPMVSDTGIITLSIDEKITESHDYLIDGGTNLSGIKTSKTQMTTEAHVPNDHYLVLSGMSRKVKTTRKIGVPVLEWIPLIGRLFSSEKEVELKKSLIIFVRPHIVENANSSG